MLQAIRLILLSVLTSIGFSIVFQVDREDLPYAGIGGGITRLFYILFQLFIPYRVLYVALAAFVSALYAEVISGARHTPATYYLYPAIVPLIPGDLFYYMCAYLITGDMSMFRYYLMECLLALVGLGVGFVVCSCFSNYMRIKELANMG